nr:MAG TPA: hypothetical protein [Caudoviricetes sp.]
MSDLKSLNVLNLEPTFVTWSFIVFKYLSK